VQGRSAHRRSRYSVAATALVAAGALLAPSGVLAAANPGGTSAPTSSGGGVAPATTKPVAAKPSAKAKAKATTVKIAEVRCVPVSNCSGNSRQVSVRGRLVFKGSGLKSGMVVGFPRSGGAKINTRSPRAHLHNSTLGMVVAVPSSAHSGHIAILLSHGRQSNTYGPLYVVHHALHPPAPKPTPITTSSGTANATAFDTQGMWIWYLGQSDGGNVANILAQAHAAGVGTVYVKSSDGSTNYWSQFSAQLVAELHAGGVHVCAWQYVYGSNPAGEAELGARAVAAGADCLVIDAESEYEGRYSAAQTYITDLRAKVGLTYPIGLASFPYIDYHESFPYSVFLGPGGAQFNLPQMYWKAIGTSVDTAFAHTYLHNRIYRRPIYPLGQTYEHPSAAELLRFRELSSAYGATGLSFWDWQETAAEGWPALAAPLGALEGVTPEQGLPLLKSGSKGDEVLWMQEHLASAIPTQQTTGNFASETEANLRAFQTSHSIPSSGQTDPATWQALLALSPVAVDWTGGGPKG
jgi:Putative peptidoglycan binding domain